WIAPCVGVRFMMTAHVSAWAVIFSLCMYHLSMFIIPRNEGAYTLFFYLLFSSHDLKQPLATLFFESELNPLWQHLLREQLTSFNLNDIFVFLFPYSKISPVAFNFYILICFFIVHKNEEINTVLMLRWLGSLN